MAVFGNNNVRIDNEAVVQRLIDEGQFELEQFSYNTKMTLKRVGQEETAKLVISGDPFLLRNIEIYGHTTEGPLFDAGGQTDESFEFQINHLNSGNMMMSSAVDISAYCGVLSSQTANTFTPSVINPNTEFEFRVKHNHRKRYKRTYKATDAIDVHGNPVYKWIHEPIPSILDALTDSNGVAVTGEIYINIVFKGAKMKKIQKG